MNKRAYIICGPTASGKTSYAHRLAKKIPSGAEIICADSRQIYSGVRVITSSPGEELRSEIPYKMYNFLEVTEEFSLAKFVKAAYSEMEKTTARGKIPIFVGGTGLYVEALTEGYKDIPDPDPFLREEVRSLFKTIGTEAFFEKLRSLDPLAASKLNPGDSQRIIRAYEIFLQNGRSIFSYKEREKKIEGYDFVTLVLNPDRKLLRSNCEERLLNMFRVGAVEEVSELKKIYPGKILEKIDIIGVKEILGYLNGNLSKEEALELAKNRTNQYAKRQVTWFKNRTKEKTYINYSDAKELF